MHTTTSAPSLLIEEGYALLSCNTRASDIVTPTTEEEAMTSPQTVEWSKAVDSELESHTKNNTAILVPRPKAKPVLPTKFVFRAKTDDQGRPARFKTKFVAKGFHQQLGINYAETHAPAARLPCIRLLIVFAFLMRWAIHQMDVTTAFLYGKLE
jgi:hypothetical protein